MQTCHARKLKSPVGYTRAELWAESHGVEPGLPGLPLGARQMFWVHRARAWCAKYTDDSLRNRILTGYHAPARFRVNGPAMNSRSFARDFRCPGGARMNPEEKCEIY